MGSKNNKSLKYKSPAPVYDENGNKLDQRYYCDYSGRERRRLTYMFYSDTLSRIIDFGITHQLNNWTTLDAILTDFFDSADNAAIQRVVEAGKQNYPPYRRRRGHINHHTDTTEANR